MLVKRLLYTFCAVAFITLSGCKISYSFTGADIPAQANTFSVELFQNDAPLADPNYPLDITEDLKDLLLSQSGLDLIKRDGDLQFSGIITEYVVTPQALSGNETAAKNRLTISLSVSYVNTFEEEKNFEQRFSRFAEFDATQDISVVKESLIEEINEQLVQDIFNASLGNW